MSSHTSHTGNDTGYITDVFLRIHANIMRCLGKFMQIRDQTADLSEKYSWDRGHGRLIESRNIPKHG